MLETREWIGLTLCLALTINAYACGYVAWKDTRGSANKFFSVLFYVLGTALLGTSVYLAMTNGF